MAKSHAMVFWKKTPLWNNHLLPCRWSSVFDWNTYTCQPDCI